MTREEYEATLTPALFRYLEWVARGIVGDLADDAVQDALATFKHENFHLTGAAQLKTYLARRIEWRSINLLKKYREYVPLDTVEVDEPWVKPWDDYQYEDFYVATDTGNPDKPNELTGKLQPHQADPKGYSSEQESVPNETSVDEDEASNETGAIDEWQAFWGPQPQEYENYLQAMWESALLFTRTSEELEQFMRGLVPEEHTILMHPTVVAALKESYTGPQNRRPPGAGYNFCDYIKVHKFGYIRLSVMPCLLCADLASKSFAEWVTRSLNPVRRSVNPYCSIVRRFVGAYIPHARQMCGYTRPAVLEASNSTSCIGDDYAVHLAFSQLNPDDFALVWLLDNQGYEQVEINEADSIDDPYARALAQPFKGIGQYKISRRHTSIKERLAALYQLARLFPLTPALAERIVQRAALRIGVYEVPTDDTCRYCGGLMIQTWVDERWGRLLDDVPGVDPAYLAKRCTNCGDRIDCLTLKRRPKDYRQREEVPDAHKLARQYSLIWESDNPADSGLSRKSYEQDRLEKRRGLRRVARS